MLAAMTATPELNLSPPEAKLVADATAKVARHYSTSALPEKQMDWINLFTALSMVYFPRVMAYRMRMASEAAKDVTPARPAPVPTPTAATTSPQQRAAAASTSEEARSFAMMAAMHQG